MTDRFEMARDDGRPSRTSLETECERLCLLWRSNVDCRNMLVRLAITESRTLDTLTGVSPLKTVACCYQRRVANGGHSSRICQRLEGTV